MKFLKLSIRHFRGVEHAEVTFRRTGVTVIAGPNEIGKSSMAEAIDLLFDYPDSSQAQAVKAVQPVDRDEGAVVRLEFETGRYHATYEKGFHRRSRTELTVLKPKAESLTGRQAHARVLEILEETVDAGLWKALRIQQGQPLDYPKLDGHGSLAEALDSAAGQARAGDAEATLFDAARDEYERYFTPGGQPRTPLKEAAAEVDRCAARVAELRAALEAVEQDIAASARLDGQIATEEAQLGGLRARAAGRATELEALERQQRELATLHSRLDGARAAHGKAELQLTARRDIETRATNAAAAVETLRARLDAHAPKLQQRRDAESAASQALDAARTAARSAGEACDGAEQDLEYHRAQQDHRRLSERLARIREAEAAAAGAAAVLERNRVDGAMLEAVRDAQVAVALARGAAEMASPHVRIEALRSTTVDGAPLAAGELWETHAHEPLDIVLGDVARIHVQPAGDSHSRVEALRAAEQAYAALLERAGVPDLESARRAERERADAVRVAAASAGIVAENVRDLPCAQLESRIGQLAVLLREYPARRRAGAPIPPDPEAAHEAHTAARAARDAASRAVTEAESVHAAAREALDLLERAAAEDRARTEQQQAQAKHDAAALNEARAQTADAALEAAETEAAAGAAHAAEAVAELTARIEASDPESVRLHAETAAAAVASAERRLREAREQRSRAGGRLDRAGGAGLAESLGDAEAEFERAVLQRAAVERRAVAARLLFETLRRHRDEARRGYVRPLTERIEGLGRVVFGRDFRVELGEDLTVAQRTLNGRTVPFNSLSGGAREQISMLARLACALIVAEHGGVPLLFDDALGNSDADRLEAIGAVLALAGRNCQVIVLTCAPERYRHAGAAEVITLGGGAGDGIVAV